MTSANLPVDALCSTLELYERALANRNQELVKTPLTNLIADKFEEVGQSGKRITQKDVLGWLASTDNLPDIELRNFRFEVISNNSVLVKYESFSRRGLVYRSSLWIKKIENWQIIYHQGTHAAKGSGEN